jgi:hypothetical protein
MWLKALKLDEQRALPTETTLPIWATIVVRCKHATARKQSEEPAFFWLKIIKDFVL